MLKVWFNRILRSKTLMFNAGVAALVALEGSFSLLQPYLRGDVYAYFTVILIVGNKVLRFFTTQPISEK